MVKVRTHKGENTLLPSPENSHKNIFPEVYEFTGAYYLIGKNGNLSKFMLSY